MIHEIRNIALIGSGNIAVFFGTVFKNNGFTISKVISRNKESGKALALELETEYSASYVLGSETDLVVIAVNDDSIREVVDRLEVVDTIVCHTAGTISIEALAKFKSFAVLYPLQSIKTKLPPEEVPLLLECSENEVYTVMEALIRSTHFTFEKADSETRMYYHLAAVFANNFSNAMVAASEQLLASNHLNADILKPLIKKTFENILLYTAKNAQTGPAKRDDHTTMEKHLELLKGNTYLQEIYASISSYIQEIHSVKD